MVAAAQISDPLDAMFSDMKAQQATSTTTDPLQSMFADMKAQAPAPPAVPPAAPKQPGILTRAYRAVEPVVTAHALKSLGAPTLSELYDKAFPPYNDPSTVGKVVEFSRQIGRAVPEVGDFALTPVGAATISLAEAGPALRALVGAYFATQGAKQIIPIPGFPETGQATKQLIAQPSPSTAADFVKSTAMAALPFIPTVVSKAIRGRAAPSAADLGTPEPVEAARPPAATPHAQGDFGPPAEVGTVPPAENTSAPGPQGRPSLDAIAQGMSQGKVKFKTFADLPPHLQELARTIQPKLRAEPKPLVTTRGPLGAPADIERPIQQPLPAEQPAPTAAPVPPPVAEQPSVLDAAQPTIPETTDELARQSEQLKNGVIPVMMIPPGTPVENLPTLPTGMAEFEYKGAHYLYNPESAITEDDLRSAADQNRVHEYLAGIAESYSNLNPNQPQVAVVSHDVDGAPIRAAVTDQNNLDATMEKSADTAPGGVTVEPTGEEAARRQAAMGAPAAGAPGGVRAPTEQGLPLAAEGQPPEAAGGGPVPVDESFWRSESGTQPIPAAIEKFAEHDVIPAGRKVAGGFAKFAGEVRSALAPQTINARAKIVVGGLREMMGERMHRDALAHTDLEGFKPRFLAMPADHGFHGLDVYSAIEGGDLNRIDPQSRAFADAVRPMNDGRWEELHALGRVDHYIENYMGHLYKDPEAFNKWLQNWRGQRPMSGQEAFRRQRVYPTLAEALRDPHFHLEAAFDNPVDMEYATLAQMDKAITAHKFKSELINRGMLKWVPAGKKPTIDWLPHDDKLFKVFGPHTGAVGLPPDANITPEDVRVYGHREMGRYYSPPGVHEAIENWLSPAIRNFRSAYDLFMNVKHGMNAVNLSFSAFHALTTALNSAFSDQAIGIKQFLAGKPVEGLKSIGRGITPMASVIHDGILGQRLTDVYDGKVDDATPMEQAFVEALKRAGGSPHQQIFSPHFWRNGFKDAVARGNYVGAGVRALNPLWAAEEFSAPIFSKLVPSAKLGAFSKRAALEMQLHPGMGIDEARTRFGQIWDSMDNRFGQFNQRNMLMNNVVKDISNAVFGRPGWLYGTVREITGGGLDLLKNLNDLAHGRKTELSDRTAYTGALFLGGMALNGVVNFVMTGQMPHGIDYIMPRDGGTTEDGRPSRIVLPMYLSKDIYSWTTNFSGTAKAKLSQPLMIAGDLLQNRDFNRHKIYGEGGIGLPSYLLRGALPYSGQGIVRNVQRGESPIKTLMPLGGVMPAGRRVGLSSAEKYMQNYFDEHREITAASPTAAQSVMGDITRATRSGKIAEARALARKAIAGRVISESDVRRAVERGRTAPMIADIKSPGLPLDVALKVYELSTPAEKRLIFPEMRRKLKAARQNVKVWTPEVRQRANALFGMHLPPRPSPDFASPSDLK